MEVDLAVEDVSEVLQDETAYPVTWIIRRFNEALLLVATMFRIPGLQLTVPVSVGIGAKSIVMPKTYLHDLYQVTSATYPRGLSILPNKRELLISTGYDIDGTGPVQQVALDGKILSVWRSPLETESLDLSFYSKPKTLEAGDEFPDYIPEILQGILFRGYALKEAYLQIEDGTDGKSFNTEKYTGMVASGLAGLVSLYPEAPKARPEIRRAGSDF